MWRPLIVLFLTISVALYLLSFPYAEALHGQGSSFYRRRRHKVRGYTRFEVRHITVTVTLDGTAKPYNLVQQKELLANLKIFISIVFQVTFPELTLSCFYVLFLIGRGQLYTSRNSWQGNWLATNSTSLYGHQNLANTIVMLSWFTF